MSTPMTLGQRLQWARDVSGLSIPQAARKLDMAPDTVLAMEQGRIAPTSLELGQFASMYGIQYAWLEQGAEREVDVPATHHATDADRETLRKLFARGRHTP